MTCNVKYRIRNRFARKNNFSEIIVIYRKPEENAHVVIL